MKEVIKRLLIERIGKMIKCLSCSKLFDWGKSFLIDENLERARYNQFYCNNCWKDCLKDLKDLK